jgi:hypothetical protein
MLTGKQGVGMTAYGWLMAVGLVVLIGIVVKGFLKADRTQAIEQPNNDYGYPRDPSTSYPPDSLGGPHA